MKSFQQFYNELNEAAKYTGDKNIALLAMHGLSLRDQIHLFHWQTEVGDMHTALGNFYNEFLEQLDGLMEVVMGKYGRFSVNSLGSPAPLQDLQEADVEGLIERYVQIFEGYKDTTFSNDPEIVNIIDEIVASIQKLKYLLTMS